MTVLDRQSWQIIDRIDVPVPEIYDVRVVPKEAVAVLDGGASKARSLITSSGPGSRGVRPIPGYPVPRRRASDPSAVLVAQDASIDVQAQMPSSMAAESLVEITVMLTNCSARLYPVGVGDDYPVHLSYRWTCESGNPITPGHEPLRTILPEDLRPGTTLSTIVLVRAPPTTGIYNLHITLVQEQVFWFIDINPMLAITELVTVVPRVEAETDDQPLPTSTW